jgi:hypothetical protein
VTGAETGCGGIINPGHTPSGHPIINYEATYPAGEFLVPPVNEIQTVTNDATGGTFTLTFGGSTTGPIAFDADAATVQAALEGLASIGAGNVTVTGAPQNWTVEFLSDFGDAALLAADDTLLTGQILGTVVTETQTGFAGTPNVWFAEGKGGIPVLNMLDGNEIVHSDINAIIAYKNGGTFMNFPETTYPLESVGKRNPTVPNRLEPFREFTVIFHDENAVAQAFPAFFEHPVLSHTLHGVRDSFLINYGSGGIGSEIIANRLGVGPMHDCLTCSYEEFFLTSFTVGDPAMLVDTPANMGLETCGPDT